jgi:hypothetical protein
MKNLLGLLAILALLSSGCAMAAGGAAAALAGGIIGNSLEAGKTDTSVNCPSCVNLPEGMDRVTYEQMLRQQEIKKRAPETAGQAGQQ